MTLSPLLRVTLPSSFPLDLTILPALVLTLSGAMEATGGLVSRQIPGLHHKRFCLGRVGMRPGDLHLTRIAGGPQTTF